MCALQINNDYQAVETDIRHLEEDLQSNLNKWILAGGGSDDGASLPLTAVNVGSAVFLLLDSSWGVLGGDGKLRRMMKSFDDSRPSNTFEIQIPEHVWYCMTLSGEPLTVCCSFTGVAPTDQPNRSRLSWKF